jgi:hypothetical protein
VPGAGSTPASAWRCRHDVHDADGRRARRPPRGARRRRPRQADGAVHARRGDDLLLPAGERRRARPAARARLPALDAGGAPGQRKR